MRTHGAFRFPDQDPGKAMITFVEIDAALARAKLGIGACELHGSVTGYLCTGWAGPADQLLSALQLESDDSGVVDPLHALLEPMAAGIAAELGSGGAVVPLLPEAPLQARADGMVDWCRGFLGGLGLTGVLADAELAPATRELLDDFAHIAAMRIECNEDGHAELAAVLDFIGGGVAHLHAAFAPERRR